MPTSPSYPRSVKVPFPSYQEESLQITMKAPSMTFLAASARSPTVLTSFHSQSNLATKTAKPPSAMWLCRHEGKPSSDSRLSPQKIGSVDPLPLRKFFHSCFSHIPKSPGFWSSGMIIPSRQTTKGCYVRIFTYACMNVHICIYCFKLTCTQKKCCSMHTTCIWSHVPCSYLHGIDPQEAPLFGSVCKLMSACLKSRFFFTMCVRFFIRPA